MDRGGSSNTLLLLDNASGLLLIPILKSSESSVLTDVSEDIHSVFVFLVLRLGVLS